MLNFKVIILALLCVMTQLGGISHAGPTGVAGSKHDLSIYWRTAEFAASGVDLSSNPFRYETNQVCVFCHTPHGANVNVREDSYWYNTGPGSGALDYGTGPDNVTMLWNRDLVQADTTQMITYDSSTMQADRGQVWSYSLLCLSCHDGVSAFNVLHRGPIGGTYVGPNELQKDQGVGPEPWFGDLGLVPANIGGRTRTGDDGITHLEDDHPVSIDYYTAQSNGDTGLETPNSNGWVGDPKIRLFPRPSGSGKVAVECSSCHDVHNEGSPDFGDPDPNVRGKYPFLAVTVAGSYLCTRCHNK